MPLTSQAPAPVGELPLTGPVTVAVNVMGSPRLAVAAAAATVTEGATLATFTVGEFDCKDVGEL